MSVSRDVIADALGVPKGEVRCENCRYGERWINDAFLCGFWRFGGHLPNDAFCSFFREKDKEMEKDEK